MTNEEIQRKRQRIIDLKSVLESRESELGDWKFLKYQEYAMMGKEPPFDIEEYNSKRQEIRDEINAIEAELEKTE